MRAPTIGRGDSTLKGRDRLPKSKKEEQGTLARVIYHAPLLSLLLQLLEIILKWAGVIY
jgi:hypothetical protein